jgi:ribosomal protein S18 acetylase RimI-like enzyme
VDRIFVVTIDVRRASARDADELMALRAVMLDALDDRRPAAGDWAAAGARILRSRLGDTMAAFVVDRDDRPGLAACAVGQVDQRLPGPGDPAGLRGYVYNVATLPAYRRKGLSRACMEALLKWFAERGVRAVDLRASPDGASLYRSLGFEPTAHPAMRRIT